MALRFAAIALVASLALPSLALPVSEPFQGAGSVWLPECQGAEEGSLLITVEILGDKRYATVSIVNACTVALIGVGVVLQSIVYELEGNWEEGFTGTGVESAQWGNFVRIGPYGDGVAIEVSGCLWCAFSSYYSWSGTVSDLRLL